MAKRKTDRGTTPKHDLKMPLKKWISMVYQKEKLHVNMELTPQRFAIIWQSLNPILKPAWDMQVTGRFSLTKWKQILEWESL